MNKGDFDIQVVNDALVVHGVTRLLAARSLPAFPSPWARAGHL